MRSGSKLFVFGNRGFRTRFGKARRRRVPRPSSWGDAVVVKERIEPLAKNKR